MGKTRRHIDLTVSVCVGGCVWCVCVCGVGGSVYIANPLCASDSSQVEIFPQMTNWVSVYILSLNGETNSCFQPNYSALQFCLCVIECLTDSCCLDFNAAVEYVVWCDLIAGFVIEVVSNNVRGDGVCGNDACAAVDTNIKVMKDQNAQILNILRWEKKKHFDTNKLQLSHSIHFYGALRHLTQHVVIFLPALQCSRNCVTQWKSVLHTKAVHPHNEKRVHS